MIRLESFAFGRIYQIPYRNRRMARGLDAQTIQTHGMQMGGSITCTNEQELVRILRSLVGMRRDVLVVSPSTLVINADVYKMFRIMNAVGTSVFLLTLQDRPVWYADEVLEP